MRNRSGGLRVAGSPDLRVVDDFHACLQSVPVLLSPLQWLHELNERTALVQRDQHPRHLLCRPTSPHPHHRRQSDARGLLQRTATAHPARKLAFRSRRSPPHALFRSRKELSRQRAKERITGKTRVKSNSLSFTLLWTLLLCEHVRYAI